MDLTLFKLQGNVVVGDDTGEFLGDVAHLNDVLTHPAPLPFLFWFSALRRASWYGFLILYYNA